MLDFLTMAIEMPPLKLVAGLGFGVLITGFAALQFGILDGNSNRYAGINISGALLVLIGLASNVSFTLGLFVIAWIFLGLAGMVTRFFRDWDAAVKTINSSKAG